MKHPVLISSDGALYKRTKPGFIGSYLSSAAGRMRLAQSMIQPLRTRIDYQGIARKTFLIDQLPSGALPIYDKEPGVCNIVLNVGAYKHRELVINSSGRLNKRNSFPRGVRVRMPLFEIYSNPTIRISDIKKRRFDLIDKCKSDILAAEDSAIFSALDNANIEE
jgi:hypothetical protein